MNASPEQKQLDGVRKAAIFLLSLEQEMAAEVLGKLSRERVEQITLAIANTSDVTRDEQDTALNDFKLAFNARPLIQPAGPETARELLERSLDQNEIESAQQRIESQIKSGPFAFLHGRHPDDIRLFLEVEHPQTIAVVAAQLPLELSAQVLAGLDMQMQTDILSRVARLGPTDSELLDEIAGLLRERIGRAPVRTGGVSRAAELLRETESSTARSVVQSLEKNDAGLADSLRESLFTFNDLALLDDSTLQVVIQETDRYPWAIALKGASESVRQRILSVISPGLVQSLRDEIRTVGPVRLSEITTVQRQICETVLTLEFEEKIELPRKSRQTSRAKVA